MKKILKLTNIRKQNNEVQEFSRKGEQYTWAKLHLGAKATAELEERNKKKVEEL